jgi:WD40 repeat protein
MGCVRGADRVTTEASGAVMIDRIRLTGILAAALLCTLSGVPGQEPGTVPVARPAAKAPQVLQSADLQFSRDGSRFLAVRHYTHRRIPLVSVHATGYDAVGPKGAGQPGRYAYFPLGPSELSGGNEPVVGFEGVTAALGGRDGSLLLTTSFQTIRVWDISRGTQGQPSPAGSFPQPGPARAVLSKDGTRLLSVALAGGKAPRTPVTFDVRLWESPSGRRVGEPLGGVAANVTGPAPMLTDLIWSPDEKVFVTAVAPLGGEAASFQVWDATTRRPTDDPCPVPGNIHTFSGDSRRLMVVSRREVAHWDLADRKLICRLDAPIADAVPKAVRSPAAEVTSGLVATSADRGMALTTERDHVELWDLNGPKPTRKVSLKHAGTVYRVALSEDGRRAATAARAPDEVFVWDLQSGRAILSVPHDGDVRALAFSPDGRLLGSATDRDVFVWPTAPPPMP